MIIDLNSAKNEANGDDIKAIQLETLDSITEYIPSLLKGINTVVPELAGEEKEDTWEYLRMIIDGFNWVIEAYNGTASLINENGDINNSEITEKTKRLGDAYRAKNGAEVAAILKDEIVPFVEKVESLAKAYKA